MSRPGPSGTPTDGAAPDPDRADPVDTPRRRRPRPGGGRAAGGRPGRSRGDDRPADGSSQPGGGGPGGRPGRVGAALRMAGRAGAAGRGAGRGRAAPARGAARGRTAAGGRVAEAGRAGSPGRGGPATDLRGGNRPAPRRRWPAIGPRASRTRRAGGPGPGPGLRGDRVPPRRESPAPRRLGEAGRASATPRPSTPGWARRWRSGTRSAVSSSGSRMSGGGSNSSTRRPWPSCRPSCHAPRWPDPSRRPRERATISPARDEQLRFQALRQHLLDIHQREDQERKQKQLIPRLSRLWSRTGPR